MAIKVREGDTTDHAAAFAVWLASVTARDGTPPADEIKRVVGTNLAAPSTWLLVGEENDAMVALASARDGARDGGRGSPSPGICHIDMVFVLPDKWGTGIGGEMLDATLEEAVSRGYASAQLWVVQGNERATRLYAGRGFRHTGRITTGDAGEEIGLWARELT
jgi:GNAT superfamily N-acetyltransferase